MRKAVLSICLLAASSAFLSSCSNPNWGYAKISEEEFNAHFQTMKDNFAKGGGAYDDITIQQEGLFGQTYNYKEGEFYCFRHIAIALIIPINSQEYTWKENSSFYHCRISTFDSLTYKKEVSEEEFKTCLSDNRATIRNQIQNWITDAERLLAVDSSLYEEAKSEFYSGSGGIYRLYSKAKEISGDQTKEKEIVFEFTDEAPTYRSSQEKDGSKSAWRYSYGKAEFTYPSDSRFDTTESK